MAHANRIFLVRKWDVITGFSISCNGKEGIVAVKYEERVVIYNRDWLAGIYAWRWNDSTMLISTWKQFGKHLGLIKLFFY